MNVLVVMRKKVGHFVFSVHVAIDGFFDATFQFLTQKNDFAATLLESCYLLFQSLEKCQWHDIGNLFLGPLWKELLV
jgi:hypothetical protein